MSTFRYKLVQIFIALAFFAIVVRLVQFQLVDGSKYAHEVKKLTSSPKIEIARGEIIDRREKVLALDLTKYSLEYNPTDTKENRKKLAQDLFRITGFNKPKLLSNKYSKVLQHDLSKEQAAEIQSLNSRLLYLHKTRSRFYPQNNLASHMLGYVDIYGKARQGLEAGFQDQLLGDENSKLQLSLDSRLQVLAEKELTQRLAETESVRGTAIVMKVKTGEILAWATKPDYNPNKYFKFSNKATKNWPLVDVYQPGSIFKIITVASALDSETVLPDYRFIDKGYLEVDKWKIKNHDYKKGETEEAVLGLQQLFERSSNPFAAHLALEMGPETFYRYIRKFGFGEKTGIELAGETNGILRRYNSWRNSDTATTGMGHGAISVTPIQLLAAINSVANEGYWVKPTLLKAGLEQTAQPRRVISPATATLISQFLKNSIQHNLIEKKTVAGKVPGLEIAGKTGTAEKIKAGGGYSKKETVASFLGYFPADSPRYICLVVLDDPKTDGRWGDTVAGPVFNRIAQHVQNLYL